MAIFREGVKPDTTALPDREIELVLAASGGDFTAFEKLISEYLDGLWRYAIRMLGNSEDAKDAVQQTLIQAYQSILSLREPARFRPWLFKIVRNKCFDMLKKGDNLRFSDLGQADRENNLTGFELVDQTPLPDELVEHQETRRLIRQAITALPEPQRQVAALRYATDLTFQEIGEVLGQKENTVKTLFQRAKASMRFYLRQNL